jgi:hypothetical protein
MNVVMNIDTQGGPIGEESVPGLRDGVRFPAFLGRVGRTASGAQAGRRNQRFSAGWPTPGPRWNRPRDYDYLVVNDAIATAVDDLLAIVRAEHRRIKRLNRIF